MMQSIMDWVGEREGCLQPRQQKLDGVSIETEAVFRRERLFISNPLPKWEGDMGTLVYQMVEAT